ncbi:MAG: glycosyltransferase family 4 protein [Lutibacter sp.]|uniref:glycosyltransferase family 4 protein n=1 Tax=Lutibacter sp. TaxID=1925666 RepID=UPI00385DCC8A
MASKTVFISHVPIPNPEIASWTNRYTKLIRKNITVFDYIIAPEGIKKISDIKYSFIKEPTLLTYKIGKLIPYYKHKVYWTALKKIINSTTNVTIHIIDNPNILFAINYYVTKNKLKNKIKIVFHMCGYNYNFTETQKNTFYKAIDTLIIQTNSSINYQKKEIEKGTCNIFQIYNGIDGKKFFRINQNKKAILKNKKNITTEKFIFLWVSQDRPKKGLTIILKAWEKLIKKFNNIELLVIGAAKTNEIKNVTWLGKIPNFELPEYYQLADFYLFSTQCNEGFGLTLGEALKCGTTCLASDIDPMKEILNNELYGRLVKNPSQPKSWSIAIQEEIEKYSNNNFENIYLKNIPNKIYDYKNWSTSILKLILKDEIH